MKLSLNNLRKSVSQLLVLVGDLIPLTSDGKGAWQDPINLGGFWWVSGTASRYRYWMGHWGDAQLDLLFTDKEELAGDLIINGRLGCSDHGIVGCSILRGKVADRVQTIDFKRPDF